VSTVAGLSVFAYRLTITAMVNALLDVETSAAAIHKSIALQFAFAVHAFFGFAACVQAFAAILIVACNVNT
jgi:hypothetical protein